MSVPQTLPIPTQTATTSRSLPPLADQAVLPVHLKQLIVEQAVAQILPIGRRFFLTLRLQFFHFLQLCFGLIQRCFQHGFKGFNAFHNIHTSVFDGVISLCSFISDFADDWVQTVKVDKLSTLAVGIDHCLDFRSLLFFRQSFGLSIQ